MKQGGYLLGFDIGSSSVKASVIDCDSGRVCAQATSPATELPIDAPQPGWAEQHPELWWEHVGAASRRLQHEGVDLARVQAVGLAYQMHGLVCVDHEYKPLRPAILWCDSRAVACGQQLFEQLGSHYCFSHLLNAPGNFTAAKLKWVKDHEPSLFRRIAKLMLPGDYLAYKLTGECLTTPSGLSEGMFWDYPANAIARRLLDELDITEALLPPLTAPFSEQGHISAAAARHTGLPMGIPLSYRAGDQPNNALSLNVLNPGDVAATAGTSGVVYGVTQQPLADPLGRVNTFVHVNHQATRERYGVLLCVNGCGILNSWIRHHCVGLDYSAMDRQAAATAPGALGLLMLPYGNGAERTLGNAQPGASLHNLDCNRHSRGHLLRAAQEGIVFALSKGMGVLGQLGLEPTVVKAGMANMFLSPLFCEAFSCVNNVPLQLYRTDGAQGAARGAGVGAGVYGCLSEAVAGVECVKVVEPDRSCQSGYGEAYERWCALLHKTV